MLEVCKRQWHIGITSFGGPIVQYAFNNLFVQKYHWLDDPTYQELFGIAQSLPGSASTKLIFIITLLRTSFLPALLSFIFWAGPGAIGMFILAVGIGQIGSSLPNPVYALLSGLNAAIVGVIFVAGLNVSARCITDKLSHLTIFLSGMFGIMYTSLWYYPVLMIAAGFITLVYDSPAWQRAVKQAAHDLAQQILGRKSSVDEVIVLEDFNTDYQDMPESSAQAGSTSYNDPSGLLKTDGLPKDDNKEIIIQTREGTSAVSFTAPYSDQPEEATPQQPEPDYPIKFGISVVVFFVISFVVIMVIRAVVKNLGVPYLVFSNMYLAGTIIFGGGPVVIPLLREYTVGQGWVSPRDFAIGLALIQAFPGPNFNFAIYLGALAYKNAGSSVVWGAIVSFIGIYAPGMMIAGGMFTFWHKLRKFSPIMSFLRGITAAATGLLWTAIYRIWDSGFLSSSNQTGESLGNEAWWYVVAATAFVLGYLYHFPTPLSIAVGGLMGIIRWAYDGAPA
ncbi:chromate transport protein ChrA [Myxozyma melibiosi]|uniref:Chromate transport protein ChrA n=1 Tax=Myxozyma melibiosi TaxID=54550 RepID=A0ABR1F4I8_9ASCO